MASGADQTRGIHRAGLPARRVRAGRSARDAVRAGFLIQVHRFAVTVREVAIRWWGSPTIRGPVVPQSQAAGFVARLLMPTAVVRTVKRRWLVLAAPDRQLVVSQEQRWTVAGPQQSAELRWSDTDGRLVAATNVPSRFRCWMQLEFVDHSTIELQLTKVAARELAAAIPQTTSPTPES